MEAGVYGVQGRLAELRMDNQIESQMDDKMEARVLNKGHPKPYT